jgi:hypothetical protein
MEGIYQMRNRAHVIRTLLLLLWISSPARAQVSGQQSPHGDWITDLSCTSCHAENAWKPLKEKPDFDHGTDGKFELLAAHSTAACTSCHASLQFSPPLPDVRQCADCHVDVHAGKLIQSCETCHNSRSFLEVDGYGIHQQTDFPLLGAHEVISCDSCHNDHFGGAYFGQLAACISCHEADFTVSTAVPHLENGFSENCETCHTQFLWADAVFPNHAEIANGFDLVGAHDFAGCESCHVQPSFQLVFDAQDQNDCFACHESDYNREHRRGDTPILCLQCHNQDSWHGAEH